jgi:NitT/TauT family transport system ATP-binding protein
VTTVEPDGMSRPGTREAGGGARRAVDVGQPAGLGIETEASPARISYRAVDVGVTFQVSSGPLEVLRGVSFEVRSGEVIGIVGRSGTGKTTLLRVLGGLLQPTTGFIELEGHVVRQPPGTAITVFQDYGSALLPWRTVERNVGLGLERSCSRAERRARVEEALRLVHLDGREKDYPWQLSGGMQQRVQIARALAMQPDVLLMDEPFGALDAFTKAALQDELLGVQQKTGCTIVFITHDIEEAIYLSDHVLVIAGMPGGLTMKASTGLERPRNQVTTREHPAYVALRHKLIETLHLGALDANEGSAT